MTRPECSHLKGRLACICNGTADLSLDKINAYRAKWGLSDLDESDYAPIHVERHSISGEPQEEKPVRQPILRPIGTTGKVYISDRPVRPEGNGRSGSGCGSCGGSRSEANASLDAEMDGGPGTELKKIWTVKGYPECDACTELAARMNSWGVRRCKIKLEEIVNEVLPRAKTWLDENRPWMMAIAKIADAVHVIDRDEEIRKEIRKDVQSAIDAATPRITGPVNESLPESNKGNLQSVGIRTRQKWAYAVMSVSTRLDSLLPRTLESLRHAGFTHPMIFVDGFASADDPELPVTIRHDKANTAGNWILSLYEMYIKYPRATRYVLFQDDFVTYRNLLAYLDAVPIPENGYFNLHSLPQNEKHANGKVGWHLSNQRGFGAVGLMFTQDVLKKVLTSEHIFDNFQDTKRGYRHIDMTVAKTLVMQGIKEYVHNPTLLSHTGTKSSMGNAPYKPSQTFRGEDFDALELLKEIQ